MPASSRGGQGEVSALSVREPLVAPMGPRDSYQFLPLRPLTAQSFGDPIWPNPTGNVSIVSHRELHRSRDIDFAAHDGVIAKAIPSIAAIPSRTVSSQGTSDSASMIQMFSFTSSGAEITTCALSEKIATSPDNSLMMSMIA